MDKNRPDINISADEINVLIHSYLVDSGFIHSAFVLRGEANLDRSPLATMLFPRGQLTEFLAKALLYTEVETHWSQSAGSCNQPFSLTGTHTCKFSSEKIVSALATATHRMQEDATEEGWDNKRDQDDEMDDNSSSVSSVYPPGKNELPPAFQRFLPTHEQEIFQCSWNPVFPELLATGSKDSTAVVWKVDLSITDRAADQKMDTIHHCSEIALHEERDVCAIEWSRDGTLLATASMDPYVRVWSKVTNGLLFSIKEHTQTVGMVRFSPNGKYLISQGLDLTTILWDVEKAKMVRKYQGERCPTAPGLQDVAWVNDTSFAVTSTKDYLINVFIVTAQMPFRTFRGHKDDINVIRVSPDRKLLASGGDDTRLRIWALQPLKLMVVAGEFVPADGSVGGETGQSCLHILKGHDAPISNARWAPATADSPQRVLVTCDDDGVMYIWDTITGTSLKRLRDHKTDIYGLSISPDARFVVAATTDDWLYIYSAEKDWEIVCSWTDRTPKTGKHRSRDTPEPIQDKRGLYETDWHRDGKRIAVCSGSGRMVLLDVSHLNAKPAVAID